MDPTRYTPIFHTSPTYTPQQTELTTNASLIDRTDHAKIQFVHAIRCRSLSAARLNHMLRFRHAVPASRASDEPTSSLDSLPNTDYALNSSLPPSDHLSPCNIFVPSSCKKVTSSNSSSVHTCYMDLSQRATLYHSPKKPRRGLATYFISVVLFAAYQLRHIF